jgi:hypothetical protein
MYEETYREVGLWFKTAEELFKHYKCRVVCDDDISYVILFQLRKNNNKISLICHDGKRTSKDSLITTLISLLNKPGWVLEASGAVSWILRKNECPIIKDINIIKNAVLGKEIEEITINEKFDITDPKSQYYTHTYFKDKGGEPKYKNDETLFGISLCNYKDTEDNCTRTCSSNTSFTPDTESITGGKKILNKKQSSKSSLANVNTVKGKKVSRLKNSAL